MRFIFSAGTLETIRLLLNQIDKGNLKLGVEREIIGKYYMNHPTFVNGKLRLFKVNNDLDLFTPVIRNSTLSYWGISLPNEYQKKYSLLNSYIRFSYKKSFDLKLVIRTFLKRLIIFTKFSRIKTFDGERLAYKQIYQFYSNDKLSFFHK